MPKLEWTYTGGKGAEETQEFMEYQKSEKYQLSVLKKDINMRNGKVTTIIPGTTTQDKDVSNKPSTFDSMGEYGMYITPELRNSINNYFKKNNIYYSTDEINTIGQLLSNNTIRGVRPTFEDFEYTLITNNIPEEKAVHITRSLERVYSHLPSNIADKEIDKRKSIYIKFKHNLKDLLPKKQKSLSEEQESLSEEQENLEGAKDVANTNARLRSFGNSIPNIAGVAAAGIVRGKNHPLALIAANFANNANATSPNSRSIETTESTEKERDLGDIPNNSEASADMYDVDYETLVEMLDATSTLGDEHEKGISKRIETGESVSETEYTTYRDSMKNKMIRKSLYSYILNGDKKTAELAAKNGGLCYSFYGELGRLISAVNYLFTTADGYDSNYFENILDINESDWDTLIITKLFFDEIDKNGGLGAKEIRIDEKDISYIRTPGLKEKIKNNNGVLHLDDLGNIKAGVIEYLRSRYFDELIDIIVNLNTEEVNAKNEREWTNKLKQIIIKHPEIETILSSGFLNEYINKEGKTIFLATISKGLGFDVPEELVDYGIFIQLSRNTSRVFNRHNQFIEKIRQRNLARNQQIAGINNDYDVSDNSRHTDVNLQTASGMEIAEEYIDKDDLDKHNKGNKFEISDEDIVEIRKNSFTTAWHNFIGKNPDLSEYINEDDIKPFYDFDNNRINGVGINMLREKLRNDFGDDVEQLIINRLSGLPDEVDDVVNYEKEHYSESTKSHVEYSAIGGIIDNIKNILDEMGKEMNFGGLCEGFKYDERIKPVEIVGDELVIKGSLNNTKTKICYNLYTGELHMNSFINEPTNSMITVGEDWNESEDYPEANTNIGSIGKFEDILSNIDISIEYELEDDKDEYFNDMPHQDDNPLMDVPGPRDFEAESNRNLRDRSNNGRRIFKKVGSIINHGIGPEERNRPGNSGRGRPHPMPGSLQGPDTPPPFEPYAGNIIEKNGKFKSAINAAIDLIGEQVKKHSEIQAKKNDIVMNFLKTFNIVNDGKDINNGQRSVKSMQFQSDSDLYKVLHIIQNSEPDQLNKFTVFMNAISRCSGLEWGNNNIPEKQKNMCFKEILNANINDEHSARGSLKKSLMNFKNETDNLKNSSNLNFDSSRPLGLAKLIVEKIIDNPKDIANSKFNISKIDNFLRSLNRDEDIYENNPDEDLEKDLANI